jgi:hypothetical protein
MFADGRRRARWILRFLAIAMLLAGLAVGLTPLLHAQSLATAPFELAKGPSLRLSRTELSYGALEGGLHTCCQQVLVDNDGEGAMDWTATTSAGWISVTPAAGSGPAHIAVAVDPWGMSAGTYTGSVTVSAPQASNSPQTIAVTLVVHTSSAPPFGLFDTPVDGSTVRGGVAVTGWALDDLGLRSVKIYYSVEGGSLFYISDAVFVAGARPDVQAAYPGYPNNDKAGWTYDLQTRFLPNGGNGDYTLWAIATDVEGHSVTLGTKTIHADNANAVKPFGGIDTPTPGRTICGNSYIVWGWALTPQPNAIPTDGSTINIYVDGVNLGHPVYNMYRTDIASLFPGYANSNGAAWYFSLNTMGYSNGVHTIQSTVTDNGGNSDGIGGRYFTIVNPCSAEPPPEIEVLGNGQTIASGDVTPSLADFTDFGGADAGGGTTARTFTIQNDGAGSLRMSRCPEITITGEDAAHFRLSRQPGCAIPAGGSAPFEITFAPGSMGLKTATVYVYSNDVDEGSYSFAIQGNGLSATIAVVKELEIPVAGVAAAGQTLRFQISAANEGNGTADTLSLRDDYDSLCLWYQRAQVPPDAIDHDAGVLRWDDLGSLAPGEAHSLWVEFQAAYGCGQTTNTATVEVDELVFQDSYTVRVLPTTARVGGFAYHDDDGDGLLDQACVDGDVFPAGCEPGLEMASSQITLPSGEALTTWTNTSGWYSFNLLETGSYPVSVAPPANSWWTPTTVVGCDALVANGWDEIHCHVGYWWGLDWPQTDGWAAQEWAAEDDAPAPEVQTLAPAQDAAISEWEPGNHGAAEHLRVRQPGVASTLVQFDLSTLPAGVQIDRARLRLYSTFGSNATNRLYMTAYPLDKGWAEAEATWTQAAAGLSWDGAGATADHGDPVGWAWMEKPGWVEFDLDPARLLEGENGWLIRGEGSRSRQVTYWFLSREYENPALQPQLLVSYES